MEWAGGRRTGIGDRRSPALVEIQELLRSKMGT